MKQGDKGKRRQCKEEAVGKVVLFQVNSTTYKLVIKSTDTDKQSDRQTSWLADSQAGKQTDRLKKTGRQKGCALLAMLGLQGILVKRTAAILFLYGGLGF